MDKCRACLASKDLIPIDEPFLQSFKLLTGLNITMPGKCLFTCKTCHDAVNLFIHFRNKCIKSEAMIQEMFANEKYLPDEKDIILQKEFKSEADLFLDGCDNEHEFVIKSEQLEVSINEMQAKKLKKKTNEKNTISNIYCGLCDNKFEHKDLLNKHLEYHKSLYNTQLSCGLCSERFTNVSHMLGHRLQHVPDEQKCCHLCGKRFAASSSTCLEFHYMREHSMAEKDAQIQCKQCPSRYSTSRKLIRHVRDCHSAPRFKCRHCNKSFRNKTLLNIHNKIKHTEGNYVKCDLCEFTSKYENSLLLHVRRKHTSNTFNCKACYRVFVDEASLKRHVADVCKHHTRVVCSVCGHTVKRVWLKRHMRSHSDEYPFKCDQCPAQYKYRTGLKDHKDKHEGTMSFQCDLCNKNFCIKSALQSHRRTHEGKKTFVCDICKASFTRRQNLKAHMNAHPWPNINQDI